MSQHKSYSKTLLVGLVIALTGCDSSYHSFDGNAGFKVEPISTDRYSIEYIGHAKDSRKDVDMMWHHAAREICRGSGYQHRIEQINAEAIGGMPGNELLPKKQIRYSQQGAVTCSAPNIAIKRAEAGSTAEHLTADNSERRHTSH